MNGVDLVCWLNQLWVLLYTAGLTDEQKVRRRDEVRSDMDDQIQWFRGQGQPAAAINRSIASRTARGVVADALWRLEAGRDGESVVLRGGNPPLPWVTMLFVGATIVWGGLASAQVQWIGDGRAILGVLSAFGAGLIWLGLYLVSHRFLGPLLLALGAAVVAWCLWWTLLAPVVAVCVAVSGVRRAQRIEALLDGR
ncbi:MAG TPA: hypothetical protein VFY90_03995 [Tepidiformaceae bacterium]|nr:hypothetical protein [Tepidiformaceae bacterium]